MAQMLHMREKNDDAFEKPNESKSLERELFMSFYIQFCHLYGSAGTSVLSLLYISLCKCGKQ